MPRPTAPSPPAAPADPFGARLAAALPGLPPAGRRIARFLAAHRPLALALSAQELAERCGASDATVVRTVQALGFAGLPDLKRQLAAALSASPPDAATALRETLAEAGAAARALDLAIEAQREAVAALAAPEPRARLAEAVALLHPARRVLAFGLGPSGALARHFALLLGRAGRAARALDAAGPALADALLDLGPGDGIVMLAYGRASREAKAIFGEAGRLGLPLVLVTDSLEPALARRADVRVPALRGRAGGVALHGAALVALEAMALGLAALDAPRALAALDRLNTLRGAIAGPGKGGLA